MHASKFERENWMGEGSGEGDSGEGDKGMIQ